MRKIVTGMFISLDGVTQSPDLWQEHFDDDMLADMQSRINNADTILLGRVTYDEWAPYWHTSTYEPFATYINNTQKCVASTTLDKVEWGQFNNITLLKGDLVEEITKLKQQAGKNIAVEGSPTLVRFLIENNLLDELKLMVHPVIAGKGDRLFRNGDALKRLKLVDTKATRTGTIILGYEPIHIT